MDLLEPFGGCDRSSARDYRVSFRVRCGDAGHEMGHARAGGRNSHTSLAGHAPNSTGNEGGVLFVPTHDSLDGGVNECIEYLVDLRSRDAEDPLNTLLLKCLGDNIRACQLFG